MPVVIWFQDTLDGTRVEGDLVQLVNNLNVAAANGKAFALLDTDDGPVMVSTKLIVKAKEDTGDAFIGGR